MKIRTIIEYLLAAVIVLMLGSLAGWYFFLRTQTQTTIAQNVARGFGLAIPEGNVNGGISSVFPSAETGTSSAKPVQRPPQLWHVQEKPIAGEAFVGSGKNVRLRYVERASGYVFEANPETGQVIRLTNTLMPKIYEALLTENGHIFERSLDTGGTITTFAGTISTSTGASSASSSPQMLDGSYLAKNIMSMSANPQTGALFYFTRNSDAVAGVSADWNGGKQKTIFSSVIMNWRPTILEDGRIILTQAAADSVPGYAYELKKDGVLSPLLGPILGLTVRVRPSSGGGASSAILWGQSARGAMGLFVRVDQNATGVLLPIRTIADKCAWSSGKDLVAYCGVPQGSAGQNFLDDWYRGAVHSSDALWRIDASAGTAEMVYTPPSNASIDIENIAVGSGEDYITFTNAADKSLWLLRLTK